MLGDTDGLSKEETKEVEEYEEEKRRTESIEREDVLIADYKRKEAEKAHEEMSEARFVNSPYGQTIIEFVERIVDMSDYERGETKEKTVSIISLDDKGVEFIFSDKRYRDGRFYFAFSALVDNDTIDMKRAFIENMRLTAKSQRSLTSLNSWGYHISDKAIFSKVWEENKSTKRLVERLRGYKEREHQVFLFESIMEKMTPELAVKVFKELKDKEEYREVLSQEFTSKEDNHGK